MKNIGLIGFLFVFLSLPAGAGDWSVVALAGSYHPFDDTHDCDSGPAVATNEQNAGVIVRYRWLLVGRYRNSAANCDGIEYSNVVGGEMDLWRVGLVDVSGSVMLADGYPDTGGFGGNYRAAASLNGRIGPVKVMYAVNVIAFGLTVDID